jgi:hypothetical protein
MKEFLFVADDQKTLFCFSGEVKNEGDFLINLVDLTVQNPMPVQASKIEGEAKKIFRTYFKSIEKRNGAMSKNEKVLHNTKMPSARLIHSQTGEMNLLCIGVKSVEFEHTLYLIDYHTSEIKH